MKPILQQAVVIKLKRSNLMLGVLCVFAMLCCGVLLAMPLPNWLKFLLLLLVLASSVYIVLRDILLVLPVSWQTLVVDTKGELKITNKRGQTLQPALADSTFIHPKLTILNFKNSKLGFKLPPVILFENTDKAKADEVRALRVWLRWAKRENNQEESLENYFADKTV